MSAYSKASMHKREYFCILWAIIDQIKVSRLSHIAVEFVAGNPDVSWVSLHPSHIILQSAWLFKIKSNSLWRCRFSGQSNNQFFRVQTSSNTIFTRSLKSVKSTLPHCECSNYVCIRNRILGAKPIILHDLVEIRSIDALVDKQLVARDWCTIIRARLWQNYRN